MGAVIDHPVLLSLVACLWGQAAGVQCACQAGQPGRSLSPLEPLSASSLPYHIHDSGQGKGRHVLHFLPQLPGARSPASCCDLGITVLTLTVSARGRMSADLWFRKALKGCA